MIRTNVTGFISPEIFPTNICIAASPSLRSLNWAVSSSSRWNARITRTPVKFSRVRSVTASSLPCTFLYSGIVARITPNTTSDSAGIAAAKIRAEDTSIVNAITIAPNTINGDRRNKRRAMLTPFWAWFISLVIRVISVDEPILSRFVKDSAPIWENRAWRTFVPKPAAAFAEKYCAVTELISPTAPRNTMTRHIFIM